MRTKMDQSNQDKRNKDLFFALLLIMCSLGLIYYAVKISLRAMKAVDATFYDAPGFSIFVISSGLLVLSVALLVNAVREGGSLHWLTPDKWKSLCLNTSSLRTIVVFFYLFLYMAGFGQPIPGSHVTVPFWISTLVFLVLMMVTFRAASLKSIVVISGLCTLSVYLIFDVLAKIPLP